MTGSNVGQQLVDLGWWQGSLIKAKSARMTWLTRGDGEDAAWQVDGTDLSEGDYLIVISQPCDILKSLDKEPYVEALRAFWTRDKRVMNDAQPNAVRYHMLHRRRSNDGNDEALIADMTVRIHFDKRSLLGISPEPPLWQGDELRLVQFADWLARRYRRAAIPEPLVQAIQKPIVEEIRRVRQHPDDLNRILDGIREILFKVRPNTTPYEVEMLFLHNTGGDAPEMHPDDVATLAGQVSQWLRTRGQAKLVHHALLDYDHISVRSYVTLYKLPLDHFSGSDD